MFIRDSGVSRNVCNDELARENLDEFLRDTQYEMELDTADD